MRLQIFDVEHGACALLTANNNTRLMIDCGHNATTSWKPGTYLQQQGITSIDMLAITNYDEDHVSGASDLFNKIEVKNLMRNPTVSASTIKKLKSDDGMGLGIERLVKELSSNFTGSDSTSLPFFDGLEQRVFYNSYPKFEDENNLSLALFLKCNSVGIMFTGDLEIAGFQELLKNAEFRKALSETRIFMAPHHGREGGCCEEAVPFLKNVNYVVISDKGYKHDTQRTIPFYSQIAQGGPFGGKTRKVLTTRNDGRIAFNFSSNSWGPDV